LILAGIQLTGADELAASWERAPQVTQRELEVFMEGATLYLEGEVKERTPAGHGTLKQSFSSEVRSSPTP
jgi:hypothetical protein